MALDSEYAIRSVMCEAKRMGKTELQREDLTEARKASRRTGTAEHRRASARRSKREKIPQAAIVRAPTLLPMMYRTDELAHDLCVERQTVIRWAQHGAPHRRDGRGHIWIHGRLLASWIESRRKSVSRKEVPADHGYCFRCGGLVRMENIRRRPRANMILLSGKCPFCGGRVNRGSKDG